MKNKIIMKISKKSILFILFCLTALTSINFTFALNFDELFETWKPREKYELINTNEYKGRLLNHKIIY